MQMRIRWTDMISNDELARSTLVALSLQYVDEIGGESVHSTTKSQKQFLTGNVL